MPGTGWVGPCWQRPRQAGRTQRTGAAGSPSVCPGAASDPGSVGTAWRRPQRRNGLHHPHGPSRGRWVLAWCTRPQAAHLAVPQPPTHPLYFHKTSPLSPALLPGAHLSKSHHLFYPSTCLSSIHVFVHLFNKY